MKEYIIKIDEDKKDIMGNCPLVEKPQELVRCKDCKRRGTYDCPVYVGGDGMCSEPDDWFCGDGKKKEGS